MARTCPIISHIFFVDDSSFFFKANRAECQNLLNILARYCSASGQNINFVKSSTLFSPNCPEDLQQQLCDLLNVQRMDLKARYLGLPSVIGRNKNELFFFILDKVLHKMQGWKQKLLSQAGREVLIKSVIQAIPSYAMQCYLLPKGFLDKLLTHIRRFFWHGDAHGKHIHWLRWDRLSKPKDEGGAWLVWDLTLLGYGKVSSTVEMFSFKVSDGRILTSFAIERKGDDSRFVIFQSYSKKKKMVNTHHKEVLNASTSKGAEPSASDAEHNDNDNGSSSGSEGLNYGGFTEEETKALRSMINKQVGKAIKNVMPNEMKTYRDFTTCDVPKFDGALDPIASTELRST
ncbi:hypothetical protein Tco_0015288 [Tanacetum coccineum]